MKKYSWLLLLCSLAINFISCKKYLEQKPDKSITVPATLQDMRAILNNQSNLNTCFASLTEIAADDYYVSSADWSSVSNENDRNNYHWLPEAEDPACWSSLYKTVLYANTVLDNIEKIEVTASNKTEWEACRGEALFFRSLAFFAVAQVYCPAFIPSSDNSSPGIPLRLKADIQVPTTRSTVAETYQRIIGDLSEAASILPTNIPVKTRPSQAAAFAALSRVYLAMEEYDKALQNADAALGLYNTLIDYNTVSSSATAPFAVFNAEVIFHGYSPGSSLLNITRCRIDSFVYASYAANDLRKAVFFRNNNNGSFGFKGSYNAVTNNNFFGGFASDELYLIKAECLARAGNTAAAMATLNQLLVKRWKTGTFIPLTAANTDAALQIILTERRKQLLFRGLRWQDLRRLNRDSRFAITLRRIINGQFYQLQPGELRYTLLIPREVIDMTGIPQNPR